MVRYLKCMKQNKQQSTDCRHLSKEYLACRMDKCVPSTVSFPFAGADSCVSLPQGIDGTNRMGRARLPGARKGRGDRRDTTDRSSQASTAPLGLKPLQTRTFADHTLLTILPALLSLSSPAVEPRSSCAEDPTFDGEDTLWPREPVPGDSSSLQSERCAARDSLLDSRARCPCMPSARDLIASNSPDLEIIASFRAAVSTLPRTLLSCHQ